MKNVYTVAAELGLKPNLLGWKNSTSPVLAEFAAGAVIVGDDCNDQFPGVEQAAYIFANQENFTVKVQDQKFILRRRDA